jgi:hypothetical protein
MRRVPLTVHDMRECRWSQPQFRATREPEENIIDAPWECVRVPGDERPVSEAECAGCERWEPDTF